MNKIKVVLDGTTAQFSDSHGAYSFQNVVEGRHTLSIDMNTLPINMIPLVKVSNEISVAEGATYVFHFPMKIKAQEGDDQ